MEVRCPICSNLDDRTNIRVCSNCQSPISHRGLKIISASPTTMERDRLTIQSWSDSLNVAKDLLLLRERFLEGDEVLGRGDPFWEAIGKHLSAFHIDRRVKGTFERLMDVRCDAYILMHEQMFSAELDRQQVQIDDAIRHERTKRSIYMIVDGLDEINRILSSPKYADLSDTTIENLVNRLFIRVEEQIFGQTVTRRTRGSGQASGSIDPDEF